MSELTVGVLTVSDRCAAGEGTDGSGPALVRMIESGVVKNGVVEVTGLVPDERTEIEGVLKAWCEDEICLILTTGGTGVSGRDVTPEATMAVVEKTVPGISYLMLKESCGVTPFAALSRSVAGIRKKSLIINLPGSVKGAKECLEAVAPVIDHAVDLIRGKKTEVAKVHSSLLQKSSVVEGNPAGRHRESPYPCISVPDAQEIVTSNIKSLVKTKIVGYKESLGHVLAEDVIAREDHPSFDASIKDGYAVLSSDKSLRRKVLGVSSAGRLPDQGILEGCCVRVSTGAAIPPGADAVVQVEDTILDELSADRTEEEAITLKKLPCRGTDIRERGSDFRKGDIILPSGTYLDSSGVGMLAAVGVTSVAVFAKPIVAVLSTGDELLNPSEDLKPGKVRDSNRITLISLLKGAGFETFDLGISRDHPDSLRDSLERGFRRADVVVTTGSMSMGERDFLKEVLTTDFKAKIFFGRVLMKPGKPTSFGSLSFDGNPKIWFGLPGNPSSAVVTSQLFLLPALRKISSREKVFPMRVQAKLLNGGCALEDRPQYVRGVLTYSQKTNSFSASAVGGSQRSSRLGSCVNANCLLVLPRMEDGSGFDTENLEALIIGPTFIA